jgi:hypothetical protein
MTKPCRDDDLGCVLVTLVIVAQLVIAIAISYFLRG